MIELTATSYDIENMSKTCVICGKDIRDKQRKMSGLIVTCANKCAREFSKRRKEAMK